jgi:hypothetical protein
LTVRIVEVGRKVENGRVTLYFRFGSMKQLFDSEDPRPLPDTELSESAEDVFFGYADEYFARKPLAFEIDLPENEVSSGRGNRVAGAVQQHFSRRIPDLVHDLILIRREGFYSLLLMIGTFLIAGLFISLSLPALLGLTSLTPETVTPTVVLIILIGFIIMIANWVTFWATIEIFIYDYRNLYRKIRIYRKISGIPVTVRGYVQEDRSL